MKHQLDDLLKLLRILLWQLRVRPAQHRVVKPLHAFGPKRWSQCAHLVDNAAKRPNVTLAVIGALLPDFGARVVGRTRLRVQHTVLGLLAYVQVTELQGAILVLEYIG